VYRPRLQCKYASKSRNPCKYECISRKPRKLPTAWWNFLSAAATHYGKHTDIEVAIPLLVLFREMS
jgi:hypothetical protein